MSAEKFLQDKYAPEHRHALLAEPADARPRYWSDLAEFGWLGAPFPESDGGFGLTLVDLAPMLEAFGAGLLLEPYVPSILYCGTFLSQILFATEREEALTAMMSGTRIDLLGWMVPSAPGTRGVVARHGASGWHLDGYLPLVPGAAVADAVWLPVQHEAEILLFKLPAETVSRRAYRLLDGQPAAALLLEQAKAIPVNCAAPVAEALELAQTVYLAAACCDAVGAMRRLLADTVEYVKGREQFGRPVGRFQAVQHGLADLFIASEEATSMAMLAAQICADVEIDPSRRRKLMAAARIKTADAAERVAHDAIQFHGGMGVTDEMMASHYFKRLISFGALHGRRATRLAEYMAAA